MRVALRRNEKVSRDVETAIAELCSSTFIPSSSPYGPLNAHKTHQVIHEKASVARKRLQRGRRQGVPKGRQRSSSQPLASLATCMPMLTVRPRAYRSQVKVSFPSTILEICHLGRAAQVRPPDPLTQMGKKTSVLVKTLPKMSREKS